MLVVSYYHLLFLTIYPLPKVLPLGGVREGLLNILFDTDMLQALHRRPDSVLVVLDGGRIQMIRVYIPW